MTAVTTERHSLIQTRTYVGTGLYNSAMRTCAECGREYAPSSGHLRCPRCRSHDVCSCGRRKRIEAKVCKVCTRFDMEFNANWKGGRTRHVRGYIAVRVAAHPRVGDSSHGYVFEHILVMEELLGRYLLPDESVHHRNGVRSDNRPENLELWVRPHPPGIRADDALAWAQEIVRRYGPTDQLQEGSEPSR